jgi:hypothetical protein
MYLILASFTERETQMSRHLQCSPRLSSADTGFNTLSIANSFLFCLLHAVAKTVTLVGFGAAVAGLPLNKRTCNKSCTPHRKDPAYLADGTVG